VRSLRDVAANFRGVITRSNSALAPVGLGVFGRVIDLGEPGSDDTPDSAASFLTPPPGPFPTCPDTPFTTTPIEQGNFIVHDTE
jgi:hypothetical protein